MDEVIKKHLERSKEGPLCVFWDDREAPELQRDSTDQQLARVKCTKIERPTLTKEN